MPQEREQIVDNGILHDVPVRMVGVHVHVHVLKALLGRQKLIAKLHDHGYGLGLGKELAAG